MQLSNELFQQISNRNIVPLVPQCPAVPPTDSNTTDFPASHPELSLAELPNLTNVQGDIFPLFPKDVENFMFFKIKDATQFKIALRSFQPTTSYDVYHNLAKICVEKASPSIWNRVDLVQTQIAFSRAGLNFLDESGDTGDHIFDKGSMRLDKYELGDREDWDPVFDDATVHGVFVVAASDPGMCAQQTRLLKRTFQFLPEDVVVISGQNIGDHKEHFGYRDGISQPALRGLARPHKGQIQVDPGVIIMGYRGDPVFDNPTLPQRPAWTKDGSIMVFRKLEQDVPTFDAYLKKNGPKWRQFVPGGKVVPPLSGEEGAALFGARIIGRWKSGAPLAKAPFRDDPDMGNDMERNNDFDYTIQGRVEPSDLHCPFIAHSRKVCPRNLDPLIQRKFLESAVIIRAGIPYGPKVTAEEQAKEHGFYRQAIGFANNEYFPITSITPTKHGQDPVIGGTSADGTANSPDQEFFVSSRGGEYFFVPSISTLRKFANSGLGGTA